MINSIRNNFVNNVKQNQQNRQDINTFGLKLKPQLKCDTVSFGSKVTNTETIEELARIATDWWTSMFNETFQRRSCTPENVNEFKQALSDLISGHFAFDQNRMYIGFDYSPDRVLSEAFESAGILGRTVTHPEAKIGMNINERGITTTVGQVNRTQKTLCTLDPERFWVEDFEDCE